MAKWVKASDEVKDMTGTERNIGPDMGRQDAINMKAIKSLVADRALGPGTTEEDFLNSDDEYKKDLDSAKAKAQKNIGADLKRVNKSIDTKKALAPFNMKKGGKVKSASARADGIAIRGRTRA